MVNVKKIILTLMVISLIFLVSCNSEEINEEQIVVIVNGQEITALDLNMFQQSLLDQGYQISNEEAKEQLINQILLLQHVENEGVEVTNDEVEQFLELELAIYGVSLEEYKQEIESYGMSYYDQLESLKLQIAINNYLESKLGNLDFEVTEEEAQELFKMYNLQSSEELVYEDVEEEIYLMLEQQKQQAIIMSLIDEMRSEAEIIYN